VQPTTDNPIDEFLRHQGVMVLDGGLATTLEARGCDLVDELWSARILLEAPEWIREVSLDFLAAGADCIATATYQASVPGLMKRGLTEAQALGLMRQSVSLASAARDEFWSETANRRRRLRPLIAASLGPYGAFLADGSEYVGEYDISDEELYAFHEPRWRTLADSEAEVLACETIPSRREAGVLLRLLGETPNRWAWVSFSCRDERHLSDGSRLVDAVRDCDAEAAVAAVGINCTAPELIPSLIAEARRGTAKPVMVYPNSGEEYDAVGKTWLGGPGPLDFGEASAEWVRAGASVVGGCCRVGPEQIAEVRCRLLGARARPDSMEH
jgi:homocysteine S-methyltransferase